MTTFHDFNVVLIFKLLKLMMYLLANETNSVTIQTCTNTVLRFLHPNWMSQENPCSLVTVTQCCVTQFFLGRRHSHPHSSPSQRGLGTRIQGPPAKIGEKGCGDENGRGVFNTAAKDAIQKAITKTSFSQISKVANIRHEAIPPYTRG